MSPTTHPALTLDHVDRELHLRVADIKDWRQGRNDLNITELRARIDQLLDLRNRLIKEQHA